MFLEAIILFAKYVGTTVEIIYMDQQGNFSKRIVDVRSCKNGLAHVYCHKAKAPRILSIGNIMAAERIQKYA